MTSFVSTRGGPPVPFPEALLKGLAPDGGLYVPARLPDLTSPPEGIGASFVDTALWVASRLLPDLAHDVLWRVVRTALDFPVPLVEVEPGLHVLELHHGPTHAFKDVGARFMAHAMTELGGSETRTILVATSGDTGGAVADAFHGLEGARVVVLFPKEGISERQRRQMTTLGSNVLALGIDGTFDDCQRLAKAAFLDPAMKERLALTSANSINVGRLLPQSFYYVHAAAVLGWTRRPPFFVVPCGNLGNLCAGLLAHRAGMPAAGFLAATNVNDVFAEYLESGVFRPHASQHTASNAMDVGDPSNLERIRWLYGDDLDALRRDVSASSVTDDDTRRCIADVFERTGYVLDPHSAVAYHVALAHRRSGTDGSPLVVLATAHPAKFPEIVRAATGLDLPLPEALARAMDREEHMTVVSPTLAALEAAVTGWCSG